MTLNTKKSVLLWVKPCPNSKIDDKSTPKTISQIPVKRVGKYLGVLIDD